MIEPLPYDSWSDEARSVLPRYLRRPELYTPGAPDARPMPNALGLFAHHVPLGAVWMEFTNMLAGSDATLPARLTEVAILRTAWRIGSRYEWKQHARIGSNAGVTTEQLYGIPDGSAAAVWGDAERAVLDATDELIDGHRITPGTWEALAAHLGQPQILELIFVVGGYLCFGFVVNSTGLPLDPSPEVVDAPEMP